MLLDSSGRRLRRSIGFHSELIAVEDSAPKVDAIAWQTFTPDDNEQNQIEEPETIGFAPLGATVEKRTRRRVHAGRCLLAR